MTTVPTNILRFNDITLKLFEKLYSSFPEGIKVEGCSVGAEATALDATFDDAFETVTMADFVIAWLGEEGFIRYESRNHKGCYFGVRLTLRGLTILGYLPSSITPKKEPLIDKIKKYVSSSAEKATGESAKIIIGELFRLALLTAQHPAASTVLSQVHNM
jgi:predicted Zn-dependent protease with MMP-like domain